MLSVRKQLVIFYTNTFKLKVHKVNMNKQGSRADIAEKAIRNYDEAKYCIDAMKRIGTYKGEKIGVITRNKVIFPRVYSVKGGDVVLYWGEGKDTTIASPIPRDEVKRLMQNGRARILGLELKTTIFHIPRNYVRELKI